MPAPDAQQLSHNDAQLGANIPNGQSPRHVLIGGMSPRRQCPLDHALLWKCIGLGGGGGWRLQIFLFHKRAIRAKFGIALSQRYSKNFASFYHGDTSIVTTDD